MNLNLQKILLSVLFLISRSLSGVKTNLIHIMIMNQFSSGTIFTNYFAFKVTENVLNFYLNLNHQERWMELFISLKLNLTFLSNRWEGSYTTFESSELQ